MMPSCRVSFKFQLNIQTQKVNTGQSWLQSGQKKLPFASMVALVVPVSERTNNSPQSNIQNTSGVIFFLGGSPGPRIQSLIVAAGLERSFMI
jgi:hypothetical protein